jgi:hypothetical protein
MLIATPYVGFGAANHGIRYVGGKTFDLAGTDVPDTENVSLTNLTGGLAASPAIGDCVVVGWSCGTQAAGNVDMAVTTGYTEIADLYEDDTVDANLGVFLKILTAADTTVTIGPSGTGGNRKTGAILVFRGVDRVTPQDVAATTATAASSALANPPSITPVTRGAWVVCFGGAGHNAGDQTFTSSDFTVFLTEGGDTAFVESTIGAGYVPWTSGAVNPSAFGFSTSDSAFYAWAACSLALRPA